MVAKFPDPLLRYSMSLQTVLREEHAASPSTTAAPVEPAACAFRETPSTMQPSVMGHAAMRKIGVFAAEAWRIVALFPAPTIVTFFGEEGSVIGPTTYVPGGTTMVPP